MKINYLYLITLLVFTFSFSQSPIVTVDRANIIGPTATGNTPEISSSGFVRGYGVNLTSGPTDNFTSNDWHAKTQAEAVINDEFIQWSITASATNTIEIINPSQKIRDIDGTEELNLTIFSKTETVKSQYRKITSWTVSVGVNAVGSLGTQNPFKRVDEFEFSQPLAVSVQHKWSRFFGIEQDITLNKFKTESLIDNGSIPEDFTYFSTNTYVKYYFSEELFPETPWVNLYVGSGLGLFTVDELNGSVNFVLGGIYWINSDIGISFQGVGKFAFNHKDEQYATNHFQYMLSGVFKL